MYADYRSFYEEKETCRYRDLYRNGHQCGRDRFDSLLLRLLARAARSRCDNMNVHSRTDRLDRFFLVVPLG